MARRSASTDAPVGQPPPPDDVDHRVTGAAVGLALLALGCGLLWFLTDRDAYLAIAIALVVCIVGDGIVAHRAVRWVRISITHRGEVTVGEPAPWVLEVQGWRRPVRIAPRLIADQTERLAFDTHAGVLPWPAMQRGIVSFAVFDALTTGPLGLTEAGRRMIVQLGEPMLVTPPATPVDLRWPRPRADGFGLVEGAPIGDDTFRSVRPYRTGDERRRVHWKATAHHGELMVRESEGTGVVTVRIVVDLGPPGPRAEHAAGVAVWVVGEALARGWGVELVTLDASRVAPVLATLGEPFGTAARLAEPVPLPLPTIAAPVRSPAEARRRLATAAHGTPIEPPGHHKLTCRVSPDGVAWS